MGRELMRVPLNFYWPLNKPWKGYLPPAHREQPRQCQACKGSGHTALYQHLHDQWYGHAFFQPSMTGSVPFGYQHPMIQFLSKWQTERSPDHYGTGQAAIDANAMRLAAIFDSQWQHHLDADDVAVLLAEDRLPVGEGNAIPEPTPERVNEWSLDGFSHDAINAWLCIKAKLRRMGEGDGTCQDCRGCGYHYSSRHAMRREFTRKDPPKGPGYQVWETVSEGSPISPVFAKPLQVVAWLMRNGYTREQAEGFVGVGWVPSLMTKGGKVHKDIEACGKGETAA